MSERRQKMLDRIIRIYGYEHPITIRFAQILESAEDFEEMDEMLENFVEIFEKN